MNRLYLDLKARIEEDRKNLMRIRMNRKTFNDLIPVDLMSRGNMIHGLPVKFDEDLADNVVMVDPKG